MEDFSKDIKKQKHISSKMRSLLDKEKSESRKRIIDRGIVHFRADADFMEALLSAAGDQKIAPGTLCRRVVWEYLQTNEFRNTTTTASAKRKDEHRSTAGRVQEVLQPYETVPKSTVETVTRNEVREIVRAELQAFKRDFVDEKKAKGSKPRQK